MEVIDPGHIYDLDEMGSEGAVELRFLKRSGRLIKHDNEHPGVLSQEVIRALIDRTRYLNDLIPCKETQDAIWHLQMALFCYEARAYRRKREKVNRQDGLHDDDHRPRAWRDQPYDDIPFNEIDIERMPVGADGHILLTEA